ncbi:hypothetical protein OIE66_36295 [Nonomuraea sp. NBC_01738]|uniref:hypothetical protein n=1 Tax=Nonomuraea sp. NBC_01738 TaxID=2976003 RepID=UPI002E0FC164|nr:hypothetical protein OIE66_36295 [Nonomuraea sp. NBC_01738]
MRAARWGVVLLVLALSGCGTAAPETRVTRATDPPVSVKGPRLTCGDNTLKVAALPEGLSRDGRFARVAAITAKKVKIKGFVYGGAEGELRIGVVCGVKSVGQFATLVPRSRLTMHHGKPALRWRSKNASSNFLWLDSPGTAVYISATPALTSQITVVANAVAPA